MPADPRIVSLTATGPDGIVVEIQLTGPTDCSAGVIRGRLDAAVLHAVEMFESWGGRSMRGTPGCRTR